VKNHESIISIIIGAADSFSSFKKGEIMPPRPGSDK
jgi:hypothetical protein